MTQGVLRKIVQAASIVSGLCIVMSAPAFAGTLDKLRSDKTIRLGVREDAPPYSYKAANGDPSGFMVDLCRRVASDLATQLGLKELAITYVPITAENRFDTLVAGKADLLCEPTSDTLSRRMRVDFSLPTLVDGASILIKGDGPNSFGALAGKKIGVLGGTTTENGLRETLKNANMSADVVLAKTHTEGLNALRKGEIAAYFGDRAILMYLASTAPDSKDLRLANDYLSLERYALPMQKGDSDFRVAVDRALSHIYRSGDIGVIFAGTFGAQVQPSDLLKTLYLVSALPE